MTEPIMNQGGQLLDVPDPLARSQHAPPMPPLPAVKSPTRAERKRSLTFVIAAAVLYQIVWVAFVEHRADMGSSSTALLVLGVVAPLILGIVALRAAMASGRRGLGVSVNALAASMVGTPILFALTSIAIAAKMTDETAPFWDRAIRCIAVTCALTAPPLALSIVVFRRAFVAASAWRTALLGVAWGAFGAATMGLACSHGEALHVIVAHGSMMLVGGILGALVGRSITRA
jgi:hypothetical protein